MSHQDTKKIQSRGEPRGGKSKKNNHYVFKIPADVFETSGGSSLTMNLEVKSKEVETVSYLVWWDQKEINTSREL